MESAQYGINSRDNDEQYSSNIGLIIKKTVHDIFAVNNQETY
jgi:hypothetical protein